MQAKPLDLLQDRICSCSPAERSWILVVVGDEVLDLLPGVAPTGRRVEMALVVIVGVSEGKVAYEHIYWDQAGLLAQLGLLDPAGLPIASDTAAQLLAFTGKV